MCRPRVRENETKLIHIGSNFNTRCDTSTTLRTRINKVFFRVKLPNVQGFPYHPRPPVPRNQQQQALPGDHSEAPL